MADARYSELLHRLSQYGTVNNELIVGFVAKGEEVVPEATQAAAEACPPQLQEGHKTAQESPP